MTHGVGTLSSHHHCGGGGHHSTFHVTHMPHTHVRNGTSRQSLSTASTDTDSEGSCALCHLVAFLLCLTKMKWQTRIVLTWVYLIAISLTVGLLVRFRHYSQQTIPSSPTDMRELDRISTLFCDTVDVDSTSVINTYALASYPPIKAYEKVVYRTTKTAYIQPGKYEYWGFYLLAGSTAEVTIGSMDMLRMYIIKGRDNLDRWMDDMDCCSEVDHVVTVSPDVINYTATHSDDYYFVFANNWVLTAYLDAVFLLVRTVYDVSAATKTCEATSCIIDLTFSTDDNIVIDVPTTSAQDVDVTLAELSGVDVENIEIAKGRGTFPYDVSLLEIHTDLDWNPPVTSLGMWPLYICDDGSLVYYRDKTETLLELDEDKKKALQNTENARLSKINQRISYSPRKEKALKIYTEESPPTTTSLQ